MILAIVISFVNNPYSWAGKFYFALKLPRTHKKKTFFSKIIEGTIYLTTLVRIESAPEEEKFFKPLTFLVITLTVIGHRNIGLKQGGPR